MDEHIVSHVQKGIKFSTVYSECGSAYICVSSVNIPIMENIFKELFIITAHRAGRKVLRFPFCEAVLHGSTCTPWHKPRTLSIGSGHKQ